MSPPKIARSVFTWKTKLVQRAPKVAKHLGYFVRNSVTKKFKKIAQSGHTAEHSNDPGTNLLFCWDTICKIIIFVRASCDAIASQRPTNLRSYNCVVVGTYSRNSWAKNVGEKILSAKMLLPFCFGSDPKRLPSVWPDWAIYWTLGNFSKLLETINLPKS